MTIKELIIRILQNKSKKKIYSKIRTIIYVDHRIAFAINYIKNHLTEKNIY